MKITNRICSRNNLLLLLAIFFLFLEFAWLSPAKVKAANENNPPSKIDLSGIFTVPMISNSSLIGKDIVQITPGTTNQKGAIWSTEINKMDLTQDFTASMYLYFGNQGNNAADGMAFVMHNDPRGINALGNFGSGLGVWASQDHGGPYDGIQNSLAVEFDTFVNDSMFDGHFDIDVASGNHVAWNYPGMQDTYIDFWIPLFEWTRKMTHVNVQYPGTLSNDKWRRFEVKWDAAKQILSYQLEGLSKISIPINVQNIFHTNQVYWGFTGSTGSKWEINRVTFDSVPGLVNAEVKETITRQDGSVVENGAPVYKGEELTYTIHAKYLSGKQDWKDIILKTVLNDNVTYIPNSMTGTLPNGNTGVLDDSWWSGQSLALNMPDMNTSMNDVTVSFKAKANKLPTAASVSEKADFVGSNHIASTAPADYVIQPNQVPEVIIKEAGPIHIAAGKDYEVKGTWKDTDDSTNTLYFSLDGTLLKSEVLDNGGSPEPVEWSYLVSKDQLKLGENHFQVKATDGDGASSNLAGLKIIVESPPAITLTDAGKEIPIDFGAGYTIRGSWKDSDSDSVDLYYVLDNNTPVNFAPAAPNSVNKGEEVNFQYNIPAGQLSLGTHQVAVYAVDDTGRKSNIEKLTVNVTGTLTFTNVADSVSFENAKISSRPFFSKRNNDWEIQVKDTRGKGSAWHVTATLTEDFSDSKGNYLKDALMFIDENGNETVMEPGVPIHVYEHVTGDQQEVSINWPTNQGMLFKINPFFHTGDYKGTMNWNLVDAP